MNAYDRALGYLSRREHTVRELVGKLSSKGHSLSEIEDAVIRLQEQDFLSDRRFAEAFIRSRLARNPEGKQILLLRLVDKGVPKSLAREVLDEYFEEHEEEIAEIYSDCQRRLEERKGTEKAQRALIRKGIGRNCTE